MNIDGGITFLPTADIEATDHFYRVICGLDLVQDQGVCRIYRVCDNCYFGFCGHIAPSTEPEKVMLTVVTNDVDEWHQRLVKLGVETDGLPRNNERFDIYHFFANDPNGYRLEVQRFGNPNWSIGTL